MIKRMPSFALPLLLLIASVVRAEVKVPAECRIKNRPPGRCGWCCLETLARYLKIKALYGLTQQNPSRCDVRNLETVLADSEIPYRVQHPGSHDQAILRHAVRENLGAVVGFRELYPGAGGHIVTLVDLTENGVQVIDPNDTDGRTRRMTLERFLYWWDGFASRSREQSGPQTGRRITRSPTRQRGSSLAGASGSGPVALATRLCHSY